VPVPCTRTASTPEPLAVGVEALGIGSCAVESVAVDCVVGGDGLSDPAGDVPLGEAVGDPLEPCDVHPVSTAPSTTAHAAAAERGAYAVIGLLQRICSHVRRAVWQIIARRARRGTCRQLISKATG
jgi:hypothetical protein